MLRKAGILYRTPKEAADKVIEISENPEIYWKSKTVQDARNVFLERFGYSRKNWMNYWIKEIRKLKELR